MATMEAHADGHGVDVADADVHDDWCKILLRMLVMMLLTFKAYMHACGTHVLAPMCACDVHVWVYGCL